MTYNFYEWYPASKAPRDGTSIRIEFPAIFLKGKGPRVLIKKYSTGRAFFDVKHGLWKDSNGNVTQFDRWTDYVGPIKQTRPKLMLVASQREVAA